MLIFSTVRASQVYLYLGQVVLLVHFRPKAFLLKFKLPQRECRVFSFKGLTCFKEAVPLSTTAAFCCNLVGELYAMQC